MNENSRSPLVYRGDDEATVIIRRPSRARRWSPVWMALGALSVAVLTTAVALAASTSGLPPAAPVSESLAAMPTATSSTPDLEPQKTRDVNDDSRPVLIDEDGRPIPLAARDVIVEVYRAVRSNDIARLRQLYRPSDDAPTFPELQPELTDGTKRAKLVSALEKTPVNGEDVDLIYRHENFDLGFQYDGEFAYLYFPQSPSVAPAPQPEAAPTLGTVWGPSQEGFGEQRPGTVYAGGSPQGLVEDLRWSSWGGPTARATGTGLWVPPNGYTALGTDSPVVVVASDLGMCKGHLAYRQVGWYFPGEGESAVPDGHGYFRSDLCGGS